MEVNRTEFDALFGVVRRIDRHLAHTQGEVLALRVAVAGLIGTHPDREALRRVLVGLDATLRLNPEHPSTAGYREMRSTLAQALGPAPPGSPPA